MKIIDGLNKIGKAINRKIKRIQRSDKETKKKWVVGSSAVIMVFVVLLWVAYINASTPKVATNSENEEAEVERSQSFFETVSRGATVLYTEVESGISNAFQNTREIFQKRREYEFNNQ